MILQMGSATTGGTGQATFTFPIAFPNAILQASATYFVNALFPNICALYSPVWGNTAISAVVMTPSAVGVSGAQVKFIAIGH
jgi:hypothetical protein